MNDLNAISHSYDNLEIIQKYDTSCVRKVFRFDLNRACQNVEKQTKFIPICTNDVRVKAVEVLEFKIYSDRAELIMPYVDGITGAKFAIYATRNVANTLRHSLDWLLDLQIVQSKEILIHTSLFQQKLQSVIENTDGFQLKQKIVSCQQLIEKLPAQLMFPIGACHGDLTLSNIILDPITGIALIDFLETYLETPLQDVAKLQQDLVYGWSFRKEPPAIKIKAEILCRYLYPHAMIEIERKYPDQVKLLTLMCLARIAPYVRDTETEEWLIKSLTKCVGNFLQ